MQRIQVYEHYSVYTDEKKQLQLERQWLLEKDPVALDYPLMGQ